jgi:hypothetical protein
MHSSRLWLLRFINICLGCSRQRVHLLLPIQSSLSVVLSQVCHKESGKGIVRLRANTQGVFSDVLVRHLPNGWQFWLPNEIYLTKEGRACDVTGVPPDVSVPAFPLRDLIEGRE